MKTLFQIASCVIFFFSCNQHDRTIYVRGEAQGTTYNITYSAPEKTNYKNEIDSLFKAVDQSLSTYVPGSIISRINRNDTGVVADKYFIDVFRKAQEISQQTNGAFDVTVAPIVNAWGFGFTKRARIDSATIDSLLRFVGYQKIKLEGGAIVKTNPGMMLDFNAIAQGYTVDLLSSFLESKGINNYLIFCKFLIFYPCPLYI